MKPRICPVCQLRPGSKVQMCQPCAQSYDTTLGGDIISVIVWAAERARYFHGRRPIECSGCKNVVPARGDCPHCGMPAEIDGGVPTRHRAR